MPVNLFDMARANDASWEDRYRSCLNGLAQDQQTTLSRFAGRVQSDCRVAFNTKASTLLKYFQSGQRITIYDVARLDAHQKGITEEAALRNKLGSYYDRRLAFDALFIGAPEFRYAALWLGGPGSHYGDFCVVYTHPIVEHVYLKHDSLNHYFVAPAAPLPVDYDLATEQHRHHLASEKHASDLPAEDQRWGRYVCNKAVYIEVILSASTPPENVEKVITTRDHSDNYRKLAFRALTQVLPPSDAAAFTDGTMLREELRSRSLVLETVDD